jgi:hypothetical protein
MVLMRKDSLSVSGPIRGFAVVSDLRTSVCALAIGLLFAAAAKAESGAYVPYSGIIHGTEGATAVTLSAENHTNTALTCEAGLAHWYSETLGSVPPGTALELTLWHAPETGVLNLLNATDDRMPVEAIWCGRANDFTNTRTRLTLPMQKGELQSSAYRFVCAADGDAPRLKCAAVKD